jgi:flagellar protein FliO/FliZ
MKNISQGYGFIVAQVRISFFIILISCFSVSNAGADVSAELATQNVASQQPASIQSAIKPTVTSENKTSSATQLANLLGGLALILGLIYALSWFVKRFNQGGFTQSSAIKMLAAMPLGTRERLMLVDVGGKQILLGITAQNINSLHVFDTPIVTATDANTKTPSDFSQKLMALLQNKELQQKNNATTDSAAPKDLHP